MKFFFARHNEVKRPALLSNGINHHFRRVRKSNKLVIFFSAVGTFKKPGSFDFWQSAKQIKHNVLLLSNGPRQWYQSGIDGIGETFDDVVDEINELRDWIGVTDTVTVGQSMGGFGAIRYGLALNANILAAATELKLMIPYSRSRILMEEGTDIVCDNLHLQIERHQKRFLLIVGELDAVDVYCASLVRHLKNCDVRCLADVGHMPLGHLKATGRLNDTLTRFISDKHIEPFQEEIDVFSNPDFAKSFFKQFQLQRRKKWQEAIEEGNKALLAYPMATKPVLFLGMAHMQLGNHQTAFPYCALAAARSPDFLPARFQLGLCLRRLGHPKEALKIHLETMASKDPMPHVYADAGLCLWEIGDYRGAARYFKKAVEEGPDVVKYQTLLSKAEAKIS